jgi:hypothetical protein
MRGRRRLIIGALVGLRRIPPVVPPCVPAEKVLYRDNRPPITIFGSYHFGASRQRDQFIKILPLRKISSDNLHSGLICPAAILSECEICEIATLLSLSVARPISFNFLDHPSLLSDLTSPVTQWCLITQEKTQFQ